MEEEKYKIEEELMCVRLELEQRQLEVATLQSGKEQLEQYVAQLAEVPKHAVVKAIIFPLTTVSCFPLSFKLLGDGKGDIADGINEGGIPNRKFIQVDRFVGVPFL